MKLTRLTHNICCARMIAIQSDTFSLNCPTCGKAFDISSWTCEPLPCPYEEQTFLRCAIVVKPTRGSFLEYNIGDDLHIGISDSRSFVHSFWANGISAEDVNWDKSVIIWRFQNDGDKFDRSLSSFIECCSGQFVGQLYNDTRWNCFDFVIEFMRFIRFGSFTRESFVSEFMRKTMSNAVKYSVLVRKNLVVTVYLLHVIISSLKPYGIMCSINSVRC